MLSVFLALEGAAAVGAAAAGGIGETFLSVALISALFFGAERLIKALSGKNENKSAEYKHQERIIELMQSSNSNSEKLLTSIDGLRDDVNGLKEGLNGLNERVLKLEEDKIKE